MEFNIGDVLALSFGLWAGVVGIGVRYVVSVLDKHEARVAVLEKKIARLEWELPPKSNR